MTFDLLLVDLIVDAISLFREWFLSLVFYLPIFCIALTDSFFTVIVVAHFSLISFWFFVRLPAIMTSVILFGFLGVCGGDRQTTTRKVRGREVHSSYTVYTTAIHGSLHPSSAPAKLRVWSTSSDVVYEDNTIIFVIAKLYTHTNNSILLDSMYIGNVPGDPESSTYEEAVPNIGGGPFVMILGPVVKVADTRASPLKTFTVGASEYVRDKLKYSQILYVLLSFLFRELSIAVY